MSDEQSAGADAAAAVSPPCRSMSPRHAIGAGTVTPWGVAQSSEAYGEGVVSHSTASHGGFALDAERNAQMPDALRVEGGWYEEDCEWSKVAVAFPALFTEEEVTQADRTLRDWYPDAWEAVHGTVLAPGESFVKDQRQFHRDHAADWVVISAVSSSARPGMVACGATLGGERGRGRVRTFLVPAREYAFGRFGFVIDPARHQPL